MSAFRAWLNKPLSNRQTAWMIRAFFGLLPVALGCLLAFFAAAPVVGVLFAAVCCYVAGMAVQSLRIKDRERGVKW